MRLPSSLWALLQRGRRDAKIPSSRTRSYGSFGLAVQTFAQVLLPALLAMMAMLPGPASSAPDQPVQIVALGDSLTAGYGLPAAEAFPAKLAKALSAKGIAVTIANAGVSGDTVAGGLARFDWSVPEGTQAVILELGANDALRGFDPKITREGLSQILQKLKARGIVVLLCGMLAPRNLGADYAARFDPIYPELAKTYDAILYPFFLEGVATNPRLNQGDGLHPTATGVDEIVRRILPRAEELIGRVKARGDR